MVLFNIDNQVPILLDLNVAACDQSVSASPPLSELRHPPRQVVLNSAQHLTLFSALFSPPHHLQYLCHQAKDLTLLATSSYILTAINSLPAHHLQETVLYSAVARYRRHVDGPRGSWSCRKLLRFPGNGRKSLADIAGHHTQQQPSLGKRATAEIGVPLH